MPCVPVSLVSSVTDVSVDVWNQLDVYSSDDNDDDAQSTTTEYDISHSQHGILFFSILPLKVKAE